MACSKLFSLTPCSSSSRISVERSFPSLSANSRSFFIVSLGSLRLIVSDKESPYYGRYLSCYINVVELPHAKVEASKTCGMYGFNLNSRFGN